MMSLYEIVVNFWVILVIIAVQAFSFGMISGVLLLRYKIKKTINSRVLAEKDFFREVPQNENDHSKKS